MSDDDEGDTNDAYFGYLEWKKMKVRYSFKQVKHKRGLKTLSSLRATLTSGTESSHRRTQSSRSKGSLKC